MPYFTSDGTNIHVEVAGSGPSVLLLHELTLDHRQWTAQKEALRASRQVYRMDFRGHGRSARSVAGYTWATWAADARRGLVQFGMDYQHPGALVAHGHACEVALQVALAEPRRIQSLLLVAPILGGGASHAAEWQERLQSVRQALQAEDPEEAMARLRQDPSFAGVRSQPDLERAVKEMQQSFCSEAIQVLEGDEGEPTFHRLGECTTPTLVLRAEQDRSEFREIASIVSEQLPAGRLQSCPGTAHFPNLETPEEFNRILSDWLEESAPRP